MFTHMPLVDQKHTGLYDSQHNKTFISPQMESKKHELISATGNRFQLCIV